MQIDTRKLKKLIIKAIPYVAFSYVGNLIGFAYRTAEGDGFQEKLLPFMSNLGVAFARIIPSLHPFDILFGLVLAGVMRLVLYVKSKNRKKFRQGEEYGSAVWGGEKDIEPYMDLSCPENNVILTKTESLTMGKPSAPKFARNKNILVIGGSGSGKTRFFVKPNLMQMHSSYVVTDPKGTVLVECGRMLQRGRPKRVDGNVVYRRDDKGNYLKDKKGRYIPVYEPYKIKVFNTIDFAKSMHYNPFAYISKKNREKDILKFVEVLIKNTSSSQQPSGDDFWVKAEKLLYTAYIALIFAMYPEDEWNFETLIDMINNSECREDDEEFKNSIDLEFEIVECWLNGTKHEDPEVMADYGDIFETKPDAEQRRLGAFALKQFKAYKLAAGKTAKSILISCSTRLAPFAIDEVLEITSYDELHLDKLGDELSALFIIISDTDATFNFLVAIMYSQLFNLLCTKADNSPGGKLDYHVRCLLDEFANIGEIPQFEKLIATIRSREISASIILQAKSQLKAIYKDNADTIEGNCDTMLFLGGKEKSTLKEISESLGNETIDSFNTSTNRGQSESYGMNYQKLGKELKSQDELAVMDGGKCILQLRGVRPFFSDKFDITRHKQYPMLLDDNPEMGFNIEKYVSDKKAMRLRLSRQEKFTGYGVDMTDAGQEVTAVSAKETDNADTAISEETEEKEIYVGF
ncbi:type IV secretory system conjugative DNA transfer family protein [Ruminococcus bicirculans]|uniref:Type IV secretory system conjugative DNA transfer family protein n=3 Tax=Ruminococcus TaxID=1263 RepID=A0AAW6E9S3_9FIRM|nr:type IV secretory system conjugative DNA transfer family protein [Ruminococcus bicirculans (ex Wegman et al. 2014)]MDB8745130.1 type IV secretory system conjugative DNA transfer family protein [Ruminococcus bicirculans (ex Wegman et al. 2014)]MDB8748006.1 type IV secretory system conjugative DNA transfer family protein [Ruminococcus bicirculans (ex Wegman et al. 2014)]MDB8753232.1 type IV secretory system conjugative DNA transfer family protein [Ruminococcus bicirculans (ex Wegman et al. 2014